MSSVFAERGAPWDPEWVVGEGDLLDHQSCHCRHHLHLLPLPGGTGWTRRARRTIVIIAIVVAIITITSSRRLRRRSSVLGSQENWRVRFLRNLLKTRTQNGFSVKSRANV
jgi:hypothetical protein